MYNLPHHQQWYMQHSGAVYHISCGLCNSDIKYQGETDRPLHHRLKEHVRAAANPTAYPENTLGQHYAELYKNCNATLHVYILGIQQKTSRRKLSEAFFIHKDKPTLNDKSELEKVVKFISYRVTGLYRLGKTCYLHSIL